MSSDGELMMTILASYAQEESRSASENQKWRIKRNFEEGMPWNGALPHCRDAPFFAAIIRRSGWHSLRSMGAKKSIVKLGFCQAQVVKCVRRLHDAVVRHGSGWVCHLYFFVSVRCVLSRQNAVEVVVV